MKDNIIAILIAFVSGGAFAAVIKLLGDKWQFKAKRKADIEDREEEKADKTEELRESLDNLDAWMREKTEETDAQFGELKTMYSSLANALKLILLDRILYLGQSYLNKGEVSIYDRQRLHAMHECYHKGLGGNGDADLIMRAVDELPLKK